MLLEKCACVGHSTQRQHSVYLSAKTVNLDSIVVQGSDRERGFPGIRHAFQIDVVNAVALAVIAVMVVTVEPCDHGAVAVDHCQDFVGVPEVMTVFGVDRKMGEENGTLTIGICVRQGLIYPREQGIADGAIPVGGIGKACLLNPQIAKVLRAIRGPSKTRKTQLPSEKL